EKGPKETGLAGPPVGLNDKQMGQVAYPSRRGDSFKEQYVPYQFRGDPSRSVSCVLVLAFPNTEETHAAGNRPVLRGHRKTAVTGGEKRGSARPPPHLGRKRRRQARVHAQPHALLPRGALVPRRPRVPGLP